MMQRLDSCDSKQVSKYASNEVILLDLLASHRFKHLLQLDSKLLDVVHHDACLHINHINYSKLMFIYVYKLKLKALVTAADSYNMQS